MSDSKLGVILSQKLPQRCAPCIIFHRKVLLSSAVQSIRVGMLARIISRFVEVVFRAVIYDTLIESMVSVVTFSAPWLVYLRHRSRSLHCDFFDTNPSEVFPLW